MDMLVFTEFVVAHVIVILDDFADIHAREASPVKGMKFLS